jgi:antitoxin PrlF
MIDMESAITVKGQATIPKPIREHLGVEPGDRLKFFIHPDGTVVILPKIPVSALKGIISSRRRKAPSIEEMHEAIATSATAGIRRVKRS